MSAAVIAVLAGALIGLTMGALGGGGSILTVPVLVYALGQEPQPATTASLIIVGITSVTATVGHARAGRVNWRAAVVFGVLGILASFGGSVLNRMVNPQVLLLAFAALMIVAAAAMFARTRRRGDADVRASDTASDTEAQAENPGRRRLVRRVRVVLAALVVGFLTGFLGVGGGFLIVPALVLALGFSMPTAVGTSLVVIAMTSIGALAERAGHASVPWAVVIPFTLAAIVGSQFGKRVSDTVSPTMLTRSFATLLSLVAGYVLVRAGASL